PMKSAIVTTPAGDLETPLLAVIVPAGTTVPASLAALDRATGGVMARAIAGGDFKGKRDETQLLYPAAGKIQRLLVVGIGKSAAGARYTRHLQMLPGNVCTPTYLADQAVALGKKHGVKVTVLDLAAIKKEGMGALLAVAQGSAQEPRFITLEYQGGGDGGPVVLVGKGVTFDSGGISIKPAQSM